MVRRSRGYLPHYDVPDATQMITFRLLDSLPAAAGASLLKGAVKDAARRRCFEALLDAGYGSCVLRHPSVGAIVHEALLHFDGQRYSLLAWVVMPNHVHTLVRPNPDYPIAGIVQAWKSFTAHAANKLLGSRGALWQREYFDRAIRDERHLRAAVSYIHQNPVMAHLVESAEQWPFSSAHADPRRAGGDAGVPGSQRPEFRRRLRRISVADNPSRLDRLVPHPGTFIGDPEDFVHIDWSGEWHPYPA